VNDDFQASPVPKVKQSRDSNSLQSNVLKKEVKQNINRLAEAQMFLKNNSISQVSVDSKRDSHKRRSSSLKSRGGSVKERSGSVKEYAHERPLYSDKHNHDKNRYKFQKLFNNKGNAEFNQKE